MICVNKEMSFVLNFDIWDSTLGGNAKSCVCDRPVLKLESCFQ